MLLYNGDSLKFISQLQAEKKQFEAVLTDPPYCSRISGKGLSKYYDGETLNMEEYFCENLSPAAFLMQTRLWVQEAARLLKAGGYFFIFSDFRQIPFFSICLELGGLDYRGVIVWDKKNARPQKGQFTQSCEFILWGTKGRPLTDKILRGRYEVPSILSKLRAHPCEKPVPLLEEILKILPPGSSVLDPFMGSGSTGEACRNMGLHFTGVEFNDHYFSIAKKRLLGE